MAKKFIYRDNKTGRLIPKKFADRRDPSTWTRELFDAEIPGLPGAEGELENDMKDEKESRQDID